MIAVLHNIRSLHNVGSIFRTADAAGIEKIYLCGITPGPKDIYGRPQTQFTKVSLGAEDYLLWEKSKSALTVIKKLKKTGCKILAIEQSKNSVPYYSLKTYKSRRQSIETPAEASELKSLKTALVVGNEVKGLTKSILNEADEILEIPMFGKKESLNVAVAFGIVAFEFAKKKRKKR
ncbi:MAG: TrmH family RNA methyltransferase [Patescibacteria group bacterium]|nr:TrmH family RNA methyltransferase [Patescibacteria group bacterium]